MHPQPAGGADGTGVLGHGGGQPALPVDLAAQLEQAQPQLGDHPGHLGAQGTQLVAGLLGRVGQRREGVVDAVPDHDQFLRHAVVDLPGQPLALLIRGQGAHVVEQQGRLQPQGGRRGQRADAVDHVRWIGPGAVRLQRDQPDRAYARDQRHDQAGYVGSGAAAGLGPGRDLGLLAGPRVGDGGVGIERGLPVSPVHPGLGQYDQSATAAARKHRGPIHRCDRADLLDEVLGDAARIQGRPGQLAGHRTQLGEQPGGLGIRLRSEVRTDAQPALHRVDETGRQSGDGQPLQRREPVLVLEDVAVHHAGDREQHPGDAEQAERLAQLALQRGQDHRHGQVRQERARRGAVPGGRGQHVRAHGGDHYLGQPPQRFEHGVPGCGPRG